jgi:hypothetical protein
MGKLPDERPDASGNGKPPVVLPGSRFYVPPPNSKTRRWLIVVCLMGPFVLCLAVIESTRTHRWTNLGFALVLLCCYGLMRWFQIRVILRELTLTAEGARARSEEWEAPKWVSRSILYFLTFLHVFPPIAFGTVAALRFADRDWFGASFFGAFCAIYTVLGWQRLHGKLSYTQPPPILELRRRLKG